MKAGTNKILIVGLFLSKKNRGKINRSAADQLAELFLKNGFSIIKTSCYLNKISRFCDTVFTIISKSADYKIAIVPLYGTFFSYWWSYISCTLLKLLNKKVVLIIHGGSIPERMKTNAGRFLTVIRKASIVICPSLYLLNVLKLHNVNGVLIENVVNLNEYYFQFKEKFEPRILWMRTLNEIYNPEMAVRVTALLSKKYPEMKMVIAGRDDGSLEHLTEQAKQLSVQHLIELPGHINNDEKNRYASNLDIYICTNRIDNAPVSLIEMMALGLPVVSVNVGGIPYLIADKVNGLLIDLDDDEAMAAGISSIIEQSTLGKKLASNGLEYSRQFGEEPVLKKWKHVFKGLNYQLN